MASKMDSFDLGIENAAGIGMLIKSNREMTLEERKEKALRDKQAAAEARNRKAEEERKEKQAEMEQAINNNTEPVPEHKVEEKREVKKSPAKKTARVRVNETAISKRGRKSSGPVKDANITLNMGEDYFEMLDKCVRKQTSRISRNEYVYNLIMAEKEKYDKAKVNNDKFLKYAESCTKKIKDDLENQKEGAKVKTTVIHITKESKAFLEDYSWELNCNMIHLVKLVIREDYRSKFGN